MATFESLSKIQNGNPMKEQFERVLLDRFVLDVFHATDISFLTIVETREGGDCRMLMWKRGVGFQAKSVVKDPLSDLEVGEPLDERNFPTDEVIRLIRGHSEKFSGNLDDQLVEILSR